MNKNISFNYIRNFAVEKIMQSVRQCISDTQYLRNLIYIILL